METALYHPTGGFYSTGGGVGPDFFTSPTAHPAFGALIAVRLRSMWEALGRVSPMHVVEAGAGSGLLAADVLAAASGSFADALRYVTVDRAAQAVVHSRAERVTAAGLPFRGLVGCILSNELMDALPVHRFRITHGAPEELYVSTDSRGSLIDLPGPPSSPYLAARLRSLAADLPHGFHGEICPAVETWASQAAAALDRGFVLTIDYGYEERDPSDTDRVGGALQTYRRHTQGGGLYRRVGRQDITADVDFGLLEAAGERAGLRTVGRLPQSEFLKLNGFDHMLDRLRRIDLGERERQANRMGMLELVKPEGLGGFRALIQQKATGADDAARITPRPSDVESTRLPLLGPHHANLMDARYPHLAWEPGDLWPFGE